MKTSLLRKLNIDTLDKIMPEEAVGFYKLNCIVCFDSQGHRSGVSLIAKHSNRDEVFQVVWTGEITEQISRFFGADTRRATDNAACAIALLIIPELTEFKAVEQSSIGTTIDYYLSIKRREDDLIFNRAARLEVTGILKEKSSNSVESRVKEKIRRLKPDGGLPTIIVVVEFCKPWSKMVEV